MMKLILVVGALFVGAFAHEEPLSRSKRFAPFPFNIFGGGFPFGSGAYAGPGGAYAGPGGAYSGAGGAYAGAAAGANPYWGPPAWSYPQRNYFPFSWFPFPVFPFPQNWYEGENVCKEVKTQNANAPDEFNEWLKDVDSPNVNSDFSHEQETCKGTNSKFVCLKRIYDTTGGSKMQATKYECCHGFVRYPNGAPGCTESVPQPPPNSGAQTNPNDKVWYNVSPDGKNSKSSSSSSSSSSSVAKSLGKVPAQ